MNPAPVSQGLLICERVIIEAETNNASCVGAFTHWECDSFPAYVTPFYVFSSLTNAVGDGTIRVVVTEPEDLGDIVEYHLPIHFFDRLSSVVFYLQIRELVFPRPGRYSFCLFVD